MVQNVTFVGRMDLDRSMMMSKSQEKRMDGRVVMKLNGLCNMMLILSNAFIFNRGEQKKYVVPIQPRYLLLVTCFFRRQGKRPLLTSRILHGIALTPAQYIVCITFCHHIVHHQSLQG